MANLNILFSYHHNYYYDNNVHNCYDEDNNHIATLSFPTGTLTSTTTTHDTIDQLTLMGIRCHDVDCLTGVNRDNIDLH